MSFPVDNPITVEIDYDTVMQAVRKAKSEGWKIKTGAWFFISKNGNRECCALGACILDEPTGGSGGEMAAEALNVSLEEVKWFIDTFDKGESVDGVPHPVAMRVRKALRLREISV